MTAQEIRNKYIAYCEKNGHVAVPRALLVPQNDPSTLFTGSGMQPMVPYLLGEDHPKGKRIVDSQTCLRSEDMDEVGDNRHTTFFEMLGNWSLGDYYKKEQLAWLFSFLTDEIGLDPTKLYVTCFMGDPSNNIQKDIEASGIWQQLFNSKNVEAKSGDIGTEENGYKRGMKPGERIFYYDVSKNWWSRAGVPDNMPVGEPGGPDSEVFYDFGTPHDESYGENCHPNCDCGRFLEIGNSVFMAYKKTARGFEALPRPNVDFGGGLERIAAASLNTPDVFKISLLWPIVESLESLSGKKYDVQQTAMRVIADHLRAGVFLATDGVVASNNEQGYVLRRLLRRAIRFGLELGINESLCKQVVPVVVEIYQNDFPEVKAAQKSIISAFEKEETTFRVTLKKGLKTFDKLLNQKTDNDYPRHGKIFFELYDTYGFPVELSIEEAKRREIELEDDWRDDFDTLLAEQKERSRTAGKGVFKGGLADHSEEVTRYHTATHLMYQALKNVLGSHVTQRGSNITAERLRFDFSHNEKMTPEQITEVEKIVNEQIRKDLPVSWREEKTKEALSSGASGAFGDKYGETVKVYTIGDPDGEYFSKEICGGPHVTHTKEIGEAGKQFKITKEESSSAGVRRIKAVLN